MEDELKRFKVEITVVETKLSSREVLAESQEEILKDIKANRNSVSYMSNRDDERESCSGKVMKSKRSIKITEITQ